VSALFIGTMTDTMTDFSVALYICDSCRRLIVCLPVCRYFRYEQVEIDFVTSLRGTWAAQLHDDVTVVDAVTLATDTSVRMQQLQQHVDCGGLVTVFKITMLI